MFSNRQVLSLSNNLPDLLWPSRTLLTSTVDFRTWNRTYLLESILQSSWWHCLNHTYCQNSLIKHVSSQPKLIFKQDSTDSRMVLTTLTSFTVYTIEIGQAISVFLWQFWIFPYFKIYNNWFLSDFLIKLLHKKT